MLSLYTLENPVFANFAFYAALIGLKMLLMAFLTGAQRYRKKAFSNPEDARMNRTEELKSDEDVERVRRAHLNDMENILPFMILGFIYVGIDPGLTVAKVMFIIFTVCRFLHTIVYAIFVIPQPARAVAFFGGMIVNLYLAFAILISCGSII